MGKRIAESFLRIDPRSLGLFRIGMALVLIGDLFRRWVWLKIFYSNDGVLPNHNHIFNLRDKAQVWSILHAFSTPGENFFAFSLILLIYIGFLVGYKTRVFHTLSLISLVSLGSRNILLENQGNYAATAFLFFTLFLPLGSRYSIDECQAEMGQGDEKFATDLNDRKGPTDAEIAAERSPGWSPMSLAALAVTVQIALILLSSALWHRQETWTSGQALHRALYVERWVSDLGASLRNAPGGLLRGISFFLLAVEWLVPALIFIPLGRKITRGLATGLLAIYALILGLFFNFGLYAWTLLAASLLLLPRETWEVFEEKFSPARMRTVIYDVDCGVCLWISRLCKRLDKRRELVFQGNDDIEQLNRRTADLKLEKVPMPQAVTAELVQSSVVVVDAKGNVHTRSAALAEIIRVLPFGTPVAILLRLPVISHIANVFYDAFAARRTRVSELCGLNSCGVPLPEEKNEDPGPEGYRGPQTTKKQEDSNKEENAAAAVEVPSAVRTLRFLTGFIREGVVLALLIAAIVQAAKENPLPFKLPQGPKLSAIVHWPRMLQKWNVLDVPSEDGVFVIDGQTRKSTSIDPLTGYEPAAEADKFNARKLGQLWNDYLGRIRMRENEPFQRAFRDYVTKGGPALEGKPTDELLAGFDAYWIRYSIAQSGESPMRTITGRDKIFMHSRGGRLGIDRMPIIKPNPTQRPE